MKKFQWIIIALFQLSCSNGAENNQATAQDNAKGTGEIIHKDGKTVETRFLPPKGFKRVPATPGSFAEFLRKLPLKPWGSPVLYYNGNIKANGGIYVSVIDLPIGNTDLHQCADAVMHLRALYFWKTKQYDKIHFDFTNGFRADYRKWIQGKRIVVDGNTVYWTDAAAPDNSLRTFYKFMQMVYAYAGSYSLSKELVPKSLKDIAPGDVFILGGMPGHAEIVLDVAQNPKTGEKVFLLAQSYMPAQEIQILANPVDKNISPWYAVSSTTNGLFTPQYSFAPGSLKTWSKE